MQPATSANIIGPDINEFRGEVNYALLATKTPYCYLRASSSGTGRFRVDKKFLEYAKGLKSVGILSGAYHYSKPSYDLTDADRQCDDFIAILQEAYGPGQYGDLFPVIDVEAPVDKSISTDTLLDWVDRFRKRFERKTRRILMIYTGTFFIELYNNFYHSKKGFILSNMPLWIAMYKEIPGNPPYPKDQGGWTRWLIWQYTEKGEIAGVEPPTDLNYGPTSMDYLTPPRVVRNFKATPGKNQISLSWSPNTDKDLNGYNVFLNANYVTTLPKGATNYIVKLGAAPKLNQRYEVSIEAFDVTGDFSPTRAKAEVTFRSTDFENDNFEEMFVPEERQINFKLNNNYKDPVDYLEAQFIKDTEYEEFEGSEEDFEFRNMTYVKLTQNEEEFNLNSDLDFMYEEDTPFIKNRDFDTNPINAEGLNFKPVFKYYLDEEDEEFEDFDNLDNNDLFIPTSNVNHDDFDDYNGNEVYYDLEESTNEEDFSDYIRFNNNQNEQYFNKLDKKNNMPTYEDYDTYSKEENKEYSDNDLHFDSYFNEKLKEENRRYLENKADFRNSKCKKCKKYKKNKKSCYGCKYFFYNLNSNEVNNDHHKSDHEDFYHYYEEYDNDKHNKKKKHHKHHK